MGDASTDGFVDSALLEKIDGLLACGVGGHVSLPQLVVVGDQSSGKSSVLEGLTRLPFPRNTGLCTRFPTCILFRRAPETSISIDILPSSDNEPQQIAKLKEWKPPSMTSLDTRSFAGLMAEVSARSMLIVKLTGQAHSVMGLSSADKNGAMRDKGAFSKNILRFEVHGPNQQHFSVVDVPGIFKKAEVGVTSSADIQEVQTISRHFMRNPRSVIVAVIPANVDVATQEILTMAEELDPDGQRTVGVLTKPDLVDHGAEVPIIDLLRGTKHPLKLGWYMVRNLGQQQLQDQSLDRRDVEDEYFHREKRWITVDEDRLGISSLKIRLRTVLANTIRRTFPLVKSEIVKLLKEAREDVQRLGPERESTEKQRRFLLDLSMKFQDVVKLAVSAQYGASDKFRDNNHLRLATSLVLRSESFMNAMKSFGHLYSLPIDSPSSSGPSTSGGLFSQDKASPGKAPNSRSIFDQPKESLDNAPSLRSLFDQPKPSSGASTSFGGFGTSSKLFGASHTPEAAFDSATSSKSWVGASPNIAGLYGGLTNHSTATDRNKTENGFASFGSTSYPPAQPSAQGGSGPFGSHRAGSGLFAQPVTQAANGTPGQTPAPLFQSSLFPPRTPEAADQEVPANECVVVRSKDVDADLDEIVFDKWQINSSINSDTFEWLKGELRTSRGFELGTFDKGLLLTTMQTQAQRWRPFALGYISDVINTVHGFIKALLENTCSEEGIRSRIFSALVEDLLNGYKAAYTQVETLLSLELEGTPFTLNHYFNDNLEKARYDRLRKDLEPQAFQVSNSEPAVKLKDIGTAKPMNNAEHMVRELGDILEAYYKVAQKRFVDNVCLQGMNLHLITGSKSPLKRFSPAWVTDLTPEQLEEIAGEDAYIKKRRQALNKKIKELEDGKTIVR